MLLLLSVVIAVLVPLGFLFALHWLDLYGSDRPRLVLVCVGWGLVAFLLSFLANRFCIDILGLSRPFVSTRTAPFVEEIFKAGALFYFARRGYLTYVVDGAIYGFASGVGFAAIENLRYVQLFPENPLGLVVVRDFSSALAHGTSAALTGIALGAYVLSSRGNRSMLPLALGLAAAMTMHFVWNNFANYSTLGQDLTQWVLVSVGLVGMALVAATILWGLRRERKELHEALGLKVGVSAEEATVVQHMEDLDRLLAPVAQRFGADKRRHVANFLHVEAQLGLKERAQEMSTDPALRAQLATEIAATEKKLDEERRNVGLYVMLFVRSIFPQTAWSLWARLGQALAKAKTGPGASGTRLWDLMAARVTSNDSPPAQGMHARVQEELDARQRAAALSPQHLHELPEALQNCMRWIAAEARVTAEHVATGLGHQETHAQAMLAELHERGFLHRTTRDGKEAFGARPISEGARAARPHIWRTLDRSKGSHS